MFQPPAKPGQAAPKRIPFDPAAPAVHATDWSMTDVLPQIDLRSVLGTKHHTWESRRTLLNSNASATEFVVEVDDDGEASLRFGDDANGLRPAAGTAFTATYRIGNGLRRQRRCRVDRARRRLGRGTRGHRQCPQSGAGERRRRA